MVSELERGLLVNAWHNLFCTPCEPVLEGKASEKGRLRFHGELRPALGDVDGEYPCRCLSLAIHYNGEVVREGLNFEEWHRKEVCDA